ncbi:hypothetical protein RQP46_006228 [Phenoliferia psychrophenolica]
MAVQLMNNLLSHHLAANDAVPENLDHVLSVLRNERAVQRCELEEGLGGPVMNRWNLRLASLIAPTLAPALRAAGFQLLLSTFSFSTTSLLSQSKAHLALALNILGSSKPDPSLFIAALELVKLILAISTWHPEWAREVVGAAVVQRTVQSLIAAANGDVGEIKSAAIEAVVSLIPLFPTPLRPLSPSMHTLALNLICNPSRSQSAIDAGADLFAALYLLSPKGKDGLREAWRKGVEALVGSLDALVPAVTSDIFAEDPLLNHTIPPLALPNLSDRSPLTALARLEALSKVLGLILRTPTSERTGPVDVPVGALVELGVRLVGMNSEMPVKERVDPTTLTLSISLLPRLQVVGCHILAQLGLCVGPRLAANAPEVLGAISRTALTYRLRSPMRPALSTTYSLVLESMGASVDPDEGKKSLARVWRSVLEDIGSVAVEPAVVAQSDIKGRKNKRQKTYDPSESMNLNGRRARLDELDLYAAERGLATLNRLLQSPHSHFLPPKLHVATARLLLALSLDPAFFASHPSSALSPTFFPASCATRGVDLAQESDEFRRSVVRCLKASLEGANGSDGLADRAAEVWRHASTDRDPEIRTIATRALTDFSALIHPSLPPIQANTTFARAKAERLGGAVGDELSIQEGADEFGAREIEYEVALAPSTMDVDSEDAAVAAALVIEQTTVVAPAPPSFATASKGFGFATPFVAVVAPKVVEPVVEAVKAAVVAVRETVPFISAPTGTKRAASRPAVAAVEDEDDSDDDDAMPEIVMESDEEK